jgi:hypothetical protein
VKHDIFPGKSYGFRQTDHEGGKINPADATKSYFSLDQERALHPPMQRRHVSVRLLHNGRLSGGARRRGGRLDAIWIAHGSRIADAPLTDSPFSRTEAVRLIHSLLVNEIKSKRRVLVSFDFAYGYSVDFVAALRAATGKSVEFYLGLWFGSI